MKALVVQRVASHARWILHNLELTEERPDRKTTTVLPGADALLATLADVFTLHFPVGTRFL